MTLIPSDGVPLSYGISDPTNTGDFNYIMRALLFVLTLYLFLYDFSIFLKMLTKKNCKDPMSFFFNIMLHVLVINSLISADDEAIETSEFWTN